MTHLVVDFRAPNRLSVSIQNIQNKGSSNWQFYRHMRYRKLPLRQRAVPSVKTKLSNPQYFFLREAR